jgi:hypothetical protein
MPDEGILAAAEVIPEDGAETTETETTETQPVDAAVRPEYLDEQFWNTEKGEANVEGLSKSYKDLRAEFNKRNDDKVGETVEEYGTEEFYAQEGMAGMQEDGVMQMALTAAKDSGMGVKQAQDFISKIMNGMAEFAPVPVDVQAEMESLGKNGPHMVSGLKTWVDGMKSHGDINDEVHSEILKLGATAAGIKALDVLRQKSGVMNIPTGTAVSGTTHMGAEDWYTATYETHAEGNETRASYDVRMKALGTSIFGSGHGTFNGSGLGHGGR